MFCRVLCDDGLVDYRLVNSPPVAIAGGWCCRAPVAAVLGTIAIEVVVVVCAVRCAGPVYGSRLPLRGSC